MPRPNFLTTGKAKRAALHLQRAKPTFLDLLCVFFFYFRLDDARALFRCGSVNQRRLAIKSRHSNVALASIFNFTKGQAATQPVPEEVVVG